MLNISFYLSGVKYSMLMTLLLLFVRY